MKPRSALAQALPRSGIREVMDLARQMDDVIVLVVGEPSFNTPAHIIDAAAEGSPRRDDQVHAERGSAGNPGGGRRALHPEVRPAGHAGGGAGHGRSGQCAGGDRRRLSPRKGTRSSFPIRGGRTTWLDDRVGAHGPGALSAPTGERLLAGYRRDRGADHAAHEGAHHQQPVEPDRRGLPRGDGARPGRAGAASTTSGSSRTRSTRTSSSRASTCRRRGSTRSGSSPSPASPRATP